MRIVPDSSVTLYRNVDIDDCEQLVFSSAANQAAYFQSKIHPNGGYSPCTVIRKTGSLRIEKSMAIVSACNYLSFINPIGTAGDNKTIYCRIVDYEYVNNECTEISYIIDYWQTWMFDVSFNDMYIEREHLSQADWDKAETNPYDPTILEFRTSENLPISKDIEKPYYEFGGEEAEDGTFIGKGICDAYSIPNDIGMLMIFSDINLKSLDAGASSPRPSQRLWGYLTSFIYNGTSINNNLCALKLTDAIEKYFYDNIPGYTQTPARKGGQWNNSALGNITPFAGNRINAPVNYIYCDSTTGGIAEIFSMLLSWFTDNNLLDMILGIYPVPTGLMLLSGSHYDAPIGITMKTAKTFQTVTNKKLDLYPFSYYRVITPNGDVKELRMEDFNSAQLGVDGCSIGMSLDVLEKPNLLIGPISYKASGISPNNVNVNMNSIEGVVYAQFPTLPYAIDGFQSQMAAVANSIIGNNTLDYQYEMQGKVSPMEALTSEIADQAAGGLRGLLSQIEGPAANIGTQVAQTLSGVATDYFGQTAQYKASNYNRTMNAQKMSEEAYDVLHGGTDNAVYKNFQYARPAYAGSIYHQVNGDGIVNFNINFFVDILFMRVSINPTILAQYDNYFSNFGYSSGRCGIPRVVNFIFGEHDDNLLPHWQTLNGKPTTYIKTIDCKVTHSMLPVSAFIKQLFDGGIRMINGDLSGNG